MSLLPSAFPPAPPAPLPPPDPAAELAWQARRGGAITQVLAARDGPERRLVLVGKPHDGAHFID